MNIITVILTAMIAVGLIWAVICGWNICKFNSKKKDWEKEAKKYRQLRP
ncbi:MAG: hypothetical protein G01um101419_332 [Parcubacteria group bacterium Gr01-1014_19]|nr:MAG: hypothetical protein G01um101419_332 [Parcubacteria group bacterium Gr01-1014_19]